MDPQQQLEQASVQRQIELDSIFSTVAANWFQIIPDNISDDLAAIFDPFGNAVHTALSFDLVGEDVLVSGAGPIGIMAAAVAKHVGARNVVITDVNEYRLELARKMDITRAVNVAKENLNDQPSFNSCGQRILSSSTSGDDRLPRRTVC